MKALTLLAVWLLPAAALAAPAAPASDGLNLKFDPQKPLSIVADRLSADDAASQAVFSGNVTAVQDTFRLRSDSLKITYDRTAAGKNAAPGNDTAAIKHLEADGHVVMTSDEASASGDRADYAPQTGLLNMSGNVVLTQAGRVIHGARLHANTEKNTATVEGDAGNRVRVLLPGEAHDAKGKKPRRTPAG